MNIKMYFNLEDAITYAKNILDVDLSNFLTAYEGFKYVPQTVFEYAMDFHDFQMMRLGLVWYTENDIRMEGVQIPNLWVNNFRVPETASLVQVVDGNNKYVKYVNCYDTTKEVFTTTNRQFQLNSQQI